MKNFTKYFILLLTLTLGLIGSVKGATRTFVPTATGSYPWTTASNWGGTAPTTGDDVIILPAAGATVTITGVPTISLASITIGVSPTGTTGTVILQSASAVTITLTSTTSPFRTFCNLTLGTTVNITTSSALSATGTIAAGRAFAVGANSFTWNSGGNLTCNGTMSNTSGGTIAFSYAGSQTIPSNITANGTLLITTSTAATKTWNSGISVTIGGSGKLQIGGSALVTMAGTAPNYSAGASLEYSASVAQTITTNAISGASTGVNLIVSNTNTNGVSIAGGASNTFNNVTFNGATARLNLNGNTLTVNGAFSGMTSSSKCIMGGATSSANTCGLVINGTGAAGTIWISQSAGFTALKTFTFNRTSGTVTFANAHQISNGASYNLLNGAVTLTGSPTFNTAATITRVAGTISSAPTWNSATINLVYGNGSTAGDITTGNEWPASGNTIGTLTVNVPALNVVTMNTSTSQTITGTVTLTSGRFAIAANTLTLNGDFASTGTGSFRGSASSNLTVNGTGTMTGALRFDQTTVGTTNNIATYTQNRTSTGVVNLGSNLTISSAFNFGTTGGLFALNNFNLTLGASATAGGSPSVSKMIVTNGTGQMIKNFATGNTSAFTFPIGDNITGGEYSPVVLDYSANSVARNIGVRVVDANPPGTLVTDYLSRYWVFTDDQAANTYTLTSMDLYYNQSGDLNGTEANILPAGWNGSTWAPYPGSISTFSDYVTVTGNEASALLNARTITGRLTPPVYTWIATSGSGDWQTPTNWTPTRSNPTVNDVLQFINGGTPTATNVPTQTISSLEISGNTAVILTPTSTNTLTISDGTGADLDIQSGSSLSLSGNLTISFSSAGTPSTTIAGTLTVGSGSNYDGYYAATTLTGTHNNNGTTTLYAFTTTDTYNVNSGGVFVNSGTLSGFAAASFIVNNGGKYQHNLSSGTIPTATWNTGSTCEVTGAISSIPSGMSQTFSNFTWNTSTQTNNATLNSDLNVTGTFTMANSNSTTWSLTISNFYSIICANYAQTGGRLNMASSGTGNLLVSGTFTMSGGQINTTGSGSGLITFNGTASQNVNITGGTIAGVSSTSTIDYRVNGTVGINIVNGSTLTVAQGATMEISRGSITQAGTGVVTYNTTASTLEYNSTTGAQTATAVEFPSTNGPTNLIINNTFGDVTMPASATRTLSGTLTLTDGNVDLNGGTLTLGTSTSVLGTLTQSSSNAGWLYNGTFTRWFSTTSITTSSPNIYPEFPIGVSNARRSVFIYRPTSGTVAAGGTISASFTNTSGLSAITAFTDGSQTVDKRTNQFWTLSTGNLFSVTGTNLGIEVFWDNAPFTITSASQLRLIQITGPTAVGNNGSNSGFSPDWDIQRTGLTSAALNNNFYVGTASANMISNIQSVADGSWLTPATWNCSCVPGAGDNVTILNTHDVTLSAAGAVADNLTVNSGGSLTLNNATATLTIGPACGGNRNYTNNGSLTISAGTLTVGGNVEMTSFNSNFTMSGGNLVIDGNDGTSAGSIGTNTPLFEIGSINTCSVTGGTITIVDPHYDNTTVSQNYSSRLGTSFYYSDGTGNWSGNTFVLGGSSCTNSTLATLGFIIDASSLRFGNFTVNGGSGANRQTSPTCYTSTTDIVVGGTLNITTGSRLQTFNSTYVSSSIYMAGPTFTNSGTFTIATGTDFGLALSASSFGGNTTVAQTVSGAGTFTINGDMYINNTNASTPSITLSVPLTVGGNLYMYEGKTSIGANNFTLNGDLFGNTPDNTNFFIADGAGRFQRLIPANPSSFDDYLFPIGDATPEYSPVDLNFSDNSVARTIGVNVTDALHPNHDSPTAAGTARLSRYWSFSATPTTGTYTISDGYCEYLTADVSGTEADISMQNWDGVSTWTTVSGSSILDLSNRLDFGSGTTNTLFPINGAVIAGRQPPPPANDVCSGATTLACGGTVGGNTAGATNDVVTSCGGTGSNFKGVWHVMTAPAAGTITLSLCSGTNYDTYMRVYSGSSCASLTCVGADDDLCGTLVGPSQISFIANGTSNYYILVSSYSSGVSGTYSLTATCSGTSNNDCPGTTLTVNAASTLGSTFGATQTLNDNYGPGYDDDDVWYNFVVPSTGDYTITLNENSGLPTFDGVLDLRSTAACNAARIQSRDFTLGGGGQEVMRVSGLTAGTYKVRVFSFQTGTSTRGAFSIRVTNNVYNSTAIANDDVCNATVATVGTITGNDNTLAGFEPGEPTGANWGFDVNTHTSVPSNTQWYKFTPTATGNYTISASMSTGIQMGIYTTTSNLCSNVLVSGSRTEIFSGFSLSGTAVSYTSQCFTAGTTYYIQLNGDMGSTGTPSLTITDNNPVVPTANAITTFDCTSFTANWNNVSATSYQLDVATDAGFTSLVSGYNSLNVGNTTSYNVTGLTSGQQYFYRIRSTGTCSFVSANSNTQSITLPANVGTPSFTAGAATLCEGATSTYTATASNSTGITYSIFSGGATIDANTGAVSSVTSSFVVRATATGSCGANTTQDFAVTVNPLPATVVATAGTGATTTSIVANWGAAANATSYILEVSTVSNFASTVFNGNVGNVTSYSVGSLTASTTYYYRVTAVNACGNAAVSNTITYATTAPIGGFTWTGATSTDWNTASNWSGGAVPSANDDIIIPNQTNDPVLTTGADGVCKSVTINSGATVTINTGKTIDVKGNWTGANNTVSGAGDLIFSGTTAQTISGGATISNLQINNTSGVTVAAGGNLVNVTTALKLKAGQLTTNGNVKTISTVSNTAYIDDFSPTFAGTISGNVAVERYVTAGPNGYRYIGAPVATTAGGSTLALSALSGFVISGTPGQLIPLPTCSPNNSAMNSPYATFMRWEEAGPYLLNCRQSGWWFQTTGTMAIGRGYGAKLSGGNKITYTGAANTGNSPAYTCTSTNIFAPSLNGWNLVSNPFPSNIRIDNTDGNADNNMPAGFDGQVQFYQTSGPFTGTFVTFNAGTSSPPILPIALGQGFWVKVSNTGTANWSLSNDHRITTGATYYSTNVVEDHLNITVSGNGFMDQTDINFLPEATPGFDFYDASKWLSANGQPTLYTKIGEDLISINSNPSLENTVAIPMGLLPGADGEFTFNFNDIATFPQSSMIVLEDLQLDSLVDLRQTTTYTFTHLETDSADRFIIHFQPGITATVVDQDCDNATGSITFTQNGTTVWDTYNVKDNSNNTYAQGVNYTGTITVNNLAPQEYILNLTHSSGYSTQEFVTVNSNGTPITLSLAVADTTVLIGETVNFTATATGATNYAWDFGDSNTAQGGLTQQHTYAAVGEYLVTVTATNDSCSKAESKTVYVGTVGIDNTTASNLVIFGQGERVVVQFNNWGGNKADIFMYNTLGQRVESLTGVSTLKGRQEINVAGIKPGYYLIQVVSDGKIQSKKIYLGNY